MPLTIKSIIQQAMLAAAPMLVGGCGPNDAHSQVTVPWTGTAPNSIDRTACEGFCVDEGSSLAQCEAADFKGCTPLGLSSDGGLVIDCDDGPPPSHLCTGRRPEGLASIRVAGPRLGDYFAEAAQLEAASVVAFRRLARELDAHGAPAHLIDRANRAARDEVRHARAMSRIAKRFGARVPAVPIPAGGIRPLAAVARENAVEGCVRETFGAAIGTWQARASRDRFIAVAMHRIARDEAAHAQLAWDVHAWARTRVRAAVADARAAVEELRDCAEPPRELIDAAGLPGREASRLIHASLQDRLWKHLS